MNLLIFSDCKMSGNVAVILSGCGVYDGSEVHEASAVCVGLSRLGKKISFFAPNKTQHHAINHLNGGEDTQGRRGESCYE